MVRIKRGSTSLKRHKKIFNFNKGYEKSSRSLFRVSNQKFLKASTFAYKDRKKKKTNFRQIWINRVNSAIRIKGMSFNELIKLYSLSNIKLNRKIMSQLIIFDPNFFFTSLTFLNKTTLA